MEEQFPVSINDMAKLLQMRKDNNHATALLLGAQAGALFRSEHFFNSLQGFSQINLGSYTRAAQFSHHFSTLTEANLFSETDIHSIFRKSLEEVSVTWTDFCLAELIKQELFDDIICTNIDNLLEASLHEVEMREGKDFEVFFASHDFTRERTNLTRVIKIFGDFSHRRYSLKRYLDRSEKEYINTLQHILARDLLIIGLDPTWDRHVLDLIPGDARTGMIWLVSEDDLSRDQSVAALLRQRKSQVVTGREGRFEHFVWVLHKYLYGGMPLNYQLVHKLSSQIADIFTSLSALSDQVSDLSHRLQQESHGQLLNDVKDIQRKLSRLLPEE